MDLAEMRNFAIVVSASLGALVAMNTAAWFVLRAVFVSKEQHRRDLDAAVADVNRARAAEIGELTAHLETRLAGLATADHLATVRVTVAELGTRIDGLTALLGRLETPLNLLMQHHLSPGGDRNG